MFVRWRVTLARGTFRLRRRLDRFEGTVRATELWILLLLLLLLLLLTVMIQEDARRNLSMTLGQIVYRGFEPLIGLVLVTANISYESEFDGTLKGMGRCYRRALIGIEERVLVGLSIVGEERPT